MIRHLAAIVFLAIVLTSCSQQQGTTPASTAPSVGGAAAQWSMYNGTYAGDRYSQLREINPSNVASLRPVCKYPLAEEGPFQAGPVIAGKVAYVTTWHDTYALDATNCKLIWRSAYAPSGLEPFNTNRGVAIDGDMLFRGTQDGHLIALDAKSGKLLWNVKAADSSKGYFLSASPIVWDGKVYMGTAGADWGARGRMMAFDEHDGHQIWSFDLVPMGDEAGANTWGKASTATTGGGSTWSSFTLDTQTGELFVPVGNPAPDFSGDYRPGKNLYTTSLVVLDAQTGTLRWFFQTVPHDVHDYDVGAAPVLISTRAGKHLVVFGGKNGYLYALDRTTHAVVYKVAVTTIQNPDVAPTIKGVHVCPGWLGGEEWNSPVYDRVNNELIVGTVDWCGNYTLNQARYVAGKFFLGGTFIPDPYQSAHGWVTALDADSGKIVWQDKTTGPDVAAIAPTAGGIIFNGDLGGTFYAFDARSGKELYRYKTAGAMAGGVVAYDENGRQYIIADSGNVSRSIWPGASGGHPTIYIFSK